MKHATEKKSPKERQGHSDVQVALVAKDFLRMAEYDHGRSKDLTTETGDLTSRSCEAAVASILFSWMAVECFINEVPEYIIAPNEVDVSDGLRSFAEVLQEAEQTRLATPVKYQLARVLLTKTPYDRGAQPYQDFGLPRRVRNALAHYKADRLDYSADAWGQIPKGLESELHRRGLLTNDHARGAMPLVNRVGTPEVAAWAYDAAGGMIRSLTEHMPPCGMTDVIKRGWSE